MTVNYRTPGVYIEEISKLPSSVVAVETAIPAFIGNTELTRFKGEDLMNKPVEISSLLEYESIFGQPPVIGDFIVTIDENNNIVGSIPDPNDGTKARFRMANALRLFYNNGGGRCYVISIGDYSASALTSNMVSAHRAGLAALTKEDEPTLLILPDLSSIEAASTADADLASARASYHSVLIQALNQCASLGDRFLISEVWDGDQEGLEGIEALRNGLGTRNLKYGAIYHPFIRTTIPWLWDDDTITISHQASRNSDGALVQPGVHDAATLAQLGEGQPHANPTIRGKILLALDRFSVTLPPAAAIAGIYATVDRTRGVWKSPANESLASVRSLTVDVDKDTNDKMNVHTTGKSINAIRFFHGKDYMVWGARTLAGNDNEWRYVSVRRFFNMVEESAKKATQPFVFEPNDANTWTKVKAMIENFLTIQWRAGALAGAKPDNAFYVRVGLGSTMTSLDILEGRMNVEIGMAVVRPAEFIILKFSHKMQEA